jgi:hypothetical protein
MALFPVHYLSVKDRHGVHRFIMVFAGCVSVAGTTR